MVANVSVKETLHLVLLSTGLSVREWEPVMTATGATVLLITTAICVNVATSPVGEAELVQLFVLVRYFVVVVICYGEILLLLLLW